MANKNTNQQLFTPKKVNKKVTPQNKQKAPVNKKPASKTPDMWDIETKGKKQYLKFYKKDKILAKIPILPETMNELITELSNIIIVDDNIATAWTYRQPAEKDLPDFLTLMREGKILATLPVDKEVGKKLGKELSKYTMKPTFIQRLKRMRRTKPKRFYFVTAILAGIAGLLLYNIVLNIF